MAMFQNMTMQEIAERAGVSIATVSRTLNNTGPVSEATVRKIRKVMKELGYEEPKTKRERNNLILASFPELENPFNKDIIRGITNTADKSGFKVLFYANDSYTTMAGYDFLEKADFADGLLLVHTLPDPEHLRQMSLKKPVVMCSEHVTDDVVPFVAIDDFAAAYTAVNYLISTGRRKIALLNSSLSNHYAIHRERAYFKCMEDAGIPVNENWVLHLPAIDFDVAFGSVALLFQGDDRPDAIFCVSDVYAAAVIKYAIQHGIQVPEELGVMGFDDIFLATAVTPAISTVRQPAYQMGVQACKLLIEQIENPSYMANRIILNTDLVIRGSTRVYMGG